MRKRASVEAVCAALTIALGLVASSAGCHKARPTPAQAVPDAPKGKGTSGAVAPSASPLEGSLSVGARPVDLGIYVSAPVGDAFMKEARDAFRKRLPDVRLGAEPSRGGQPPVALLLAPPIDSAAPPNLESLKYFGQGLDPASARAAAE
jgi:hypothetical protein